MSHQFGSYTQAMLAIEQHIKENRGSMKAVYESALRDAMDIIGRARDEAIVAFEGYMQRTGHAEFMKFSGEHETIVPQEEVPPQSPGTGKKP